MWADMLNLLIMPGGGGLEKNEPIKSVGFTINGICGCGFH